MGGQYKFEAYWAFFVVYLNRNFASQLNAIGFGLTRFSDTYNREVCCRTSTLEVHKVVLEQIGSRIRWTLLQL